jgi:DNA-binding MarR family transcriptional regulator
MSVAQVSTWAGGKQPETTPATPPASTHGRLSKTRQANDAWESLLTAHAHLMRQFAVQDTWTEVSMRDYDVLYTLSKCDTPQRIGDLGKHVLLSQPALSRLVDRLESRGLVSRAQDPADARSVRIGLTEAGRQAQNTAGRSHAAAVRTAMNAALTPDEIAQLTTLTRKLQEAQA